MVNKITFSLSYHNQVICVQQLNSHGNTNLNSHHKASMTITNSKGLNAEPWCIPTFTSKPLLLPRTVLTLFMQHYTQTRLPIITILQLPTYALSILSLLLGPYQKLFPNPQSQIELSFSSILLWHLSYNKNCVSGSFTFHKSKLHITCINILPNSAFEDPFHHFHSMFQQFLWDANFCHNTITQIQYPLSSNIPCGLYHFRY